MASPASSEQYASEQSKKITFRFCRECANMLYPKEDRQNSTLMFACRTCPYSEHASTSACVFRNDLSNTVGETAGITQDVGSDPTVGNDSYGDTDSEMPMCTMCGQEIVRLVCGEYSSDLGLLFEVDGPEPSFVKENPESDDEARKAGKQEACNTSLKEQEPQETTP